MDASDLKRVPGAAVDAVKRATSVLRQNPALALLTSLAAGFVAGLILRRSAREPEPK